MFARKKGKISNVEKFTIGHKYSVGTQAFAVAAGIAASNKITKVL